MENGFTSLEETNVYLDLSPVNTEDPVLYKEDLAKQNLTEV